jgi:uncharacterized repeat protein (TIGR03943 family)
VNRRVQAAILGVVGVAALRLGLTGDLVFYVRERMRVPILIAGVVLIGVALMTAWPRRQRDGNDTDGSERDQHMPRAAWLLILPVVALLAFTPRPLGADSAASTSVYRYDPALEYGPIGPPRHGAVDLDLAQFWERVRFDPHHSVRNVNVRIVAFAIVDAEPDQLGRYLISCCAGDAALLALNVTQWPGPRPEQGEWLSAVIRQHGPPTKDGTVTVDVISVRPTDQPEDPYLVP